MESFLAALPLSINSKELVAPSYWSKRKIQELSLIYKAVKQSYDEGNIFDVTRLHLRTLKGVDLLTYSFPCQDLSQQGIQRGMSKDSKTRSGLLWEIEKALDATDKEHLPKYLLMENVMALMNKGNAKELKAWMDKLESLGYKNDIKVLNAGDFGSAQARKRAFMISTQGEKIDLPIGDKEPKALKEILEASRAEDYMPELEKYSKKEFNGRTKSNINKTRLENYSKFNSETYVYDVNYTGPTLTASGANSRIKILDKGKIRKLNACEAYKYMGFTKEDYERVKSLNYLNEEKMIYTCGNSISVEVLEAIFKKVV